MNNLRICIAHTTDREIADTEEELVMTPPTIHRPPIRKEVGIFHTATLVEYSVRNAVKKSKLFHNIQEAYKWILKKIPDIYDDIDDWDIRSFGNTVERLDERWYDGKNGLVVAKMDQYKFQVFYKPDKNSVFKKEEKNP